jgi:phosphatidylserine/phosphatidylglycerophosphate/cardiolipin synthase-like enzyme
MAIKAQEVDEVIELRRVNAPQIESSITIQTAITEIQSQKSELTARISDPQEQTSEAKLKERLEGLEAEISRLKAEAKVLPVKNLYMQDHPSLLNDALENAKERLLIISPWIRAGIVTKKFLRQLEAVLKRGAQVHIGHGIAPNSTKARSADVTAKQAIESLAGRYSNLHFIRLGNTHAKILIKDHDFAAVTSFNWLSFGGDPNQAYRDEQGVLLQKQDLVDAKYDEVIKQFPTA